MFGHNKNKKIKSKIQTENNEGDNVVFHTMRDDLKAMDGKIVLNEKESDEGAKEAELKKENERVSPFSGNAFKKPDATAVPPSPLYNKPSIETKIADAKSLESSTLPKNHKALKNKEKKTILSFLMPAIIILIIVSVALGSYLLWKTGNTVETAVAPPTEIPTEEPEPTKTPIEKYSSENPNYLSIDTESAASESISQLLKQTASEIKESENGKLFEFVVTDANNNPLSFSIFSYLFKISLSPEILDSLEESFSLYFYRDNENVRLGAAVDIQDTEAISSEMSKEENALVSELQPLFLSNPFSVIGESFNTSRYKDFQIRYINLNEDNTLSVDYSIAGDKLIIGTSKDTTRAIIDKIQQSNAAADAENTSAEDTDIEL